MRQPGPDGTSISQFPTRLSNPLATSHASDEDKKRTYRREDNEKGFATSFYALDYATTEQKAAVRDLVETWKQHFNAEHPFAFTGEFMDRKYKAFFDKMGAGYVFGPDRMVIREFVDTPRGQKAGYAPAADRFTVARELLEEDIHNFDPNSISVRNELQKLGGACVKRGNLVGWVIPPGADLDPEKWGADKDAADTLIENARAIAPGEYKNLVDLQISYIIDLGLDERVFGQRIAKIGDAHELGAFALRAALRQARQIYSEMVAENDAIEAADPEAEPKHRLVMGDKDRPYRSLVTAALSELGKANTSISLDDVVTAAVRRSAPNSYENLSGLDKRDDDLAKGPSGAYVAAAPMKALARQIMDADENVAGVMTRLEAIYEALPEGAKLTPMRAATPFVVVGPIVAQIWPHFVVQQHSGVREGVEFVEYYVHDRSRFLSETFKDKPAEKLSASIGHLFTDASIGEEKWNKIIERGNPVAIGSHAGVLIAMSLPRMREIHGSWADGSPAQHQSTLVEQLTRETALAGYDGVNRALSNHRQTRAVKTLAPLSSTPGLERIENQKHLENVVAVIRAAENAKTATYAVMSLLGIADESQAEAIIDTIAQFEANRDAINAYNAERESQIAADRAKVVAAATTKIAPLHKAMVDRANAAHAQAPFADSRSTAPVHASAARIPGAIRESTLAEEPKLVLGRVVDAAYSLKNLIVVQAVRRVGKGAEQTFVPLPNEYYLYNTNDSIDMFAHRNSEGRIAQSYYKKQTVILLGFSEGHLVAKKDQGRPSGQIDIDSAMQYFKERASEALAADRSRKIQEELDAKKYAHLEVGSFDSERREWLDGVLQAVRHVVANKRNIPIAKIVVENQDRDARYNEELAFNQSGIYVKPADVRQGIVRNVPYDMSLIDLGAVKWMVADVEAIEKDVVVVHAYDREHNVSRIYALQDFAHQVFPVKDSEFVTGIRVERGLVRQDSIEFAKIGIDDSGYPQYTVEIIDRGLQAALKAKNRQAEAFALVDAKFQRVELDQSATTAEAKAALPVLREAGLQPRQVSVAEISKDGHYTGIIYPVEQGPNRFVAMVVNADTYHKQNGEIRIIAIRDQDIVSRVFTVRQKDGTRPEAGGFAGITFRDGKVAVFEVKTKEDLRLAANALEEIEELKRRAASALHEEDLPRAASALEEIEDLKRRAMFAPDEIVKVEVENAATRSRGR
jgi:hypothetical protein